MLLQLQKPTSWQELQDLARDVSDPDSPHYRNYLGVDEFAGRFGAQPTDYQHIQDWAVSHGLTTKTFANNLAVMVSGTTQAIQQALYVHLNYYSRPDGTQFYGPDRQPSVDHSPGPTLPILYIENLDNMSVSRPLAGSPMDNDFVNSLPNTAYPDSFKSSGGLFIGDDLRRAYAYDPNTKDITPLTGYGQCVGLVATGGYSLPDLQTYWDGTARHYDMPQITHVDNRDGAACAIWDRDSVKCNDGTTCGTASCVDKTPGHTDWCALLSTQSKLDPTYEAVCGVDYTPGGNPDDLTRCYVACPPHAGCSKDYPPDPNRWGVMGARTQEAPARPILGLTRRRLTSRWCWQWLRERT